MDPIISPWLIYLIDKLNPAISLLTFIGGAIMLISVIAFVLALASESNSVSHEIEEFIDSINKLNLYAKYIKQDLERLEKSEENLPKEYILNFDKKQALNNINRHNESIEEIIKTSKKLIKNLTGSTDSDYATIYKWFAIGFAFCLIGFLIPSKETFVKMLIASYITPDNINAGINITQQTIEYLFDKIQTTLITILNNY
jgi:predicted PurR-regulated permease PerM